jgi:hypothetical protein
MMRAMRSIPQNPRPPAAALIGLVAAAGLAAAPLPGQTPPAAPSEPGAAPSPSSLSEQQRVVRDRLQRLESRMLQLSRLLAETEPEKAERLRDALDYMGSHRLKARLEQLGRLLETEQFGEADRGQELLLADLDALLSLLTSSLNEVERRREERQRLEGLKRAVRALLDEQTQIFYRTRHAGQRAAQAEETPGDLGDMLRQLERLQRDMQRRAGELQREMRQPAEPERSTPGEPQLGRAAGHMQRAADALGEGQPEPARQDQERALEQLQQALDQLDDALRQVRREESEETLTALEARFRSMLNRERQVLEVVGALDRKDPASWARVERLQLAEAVETQHGVRADCAATLRILVDEGTTVIVPELLRQVEIDMADVAAALERFDTARETQRVLADIIALLEEVLAAIERQRAEDTRLAKEGEQQPGDGPRPLLPGSAELKLMRSSQLRLNQRTVELAVSPAEFEDERVDDLEQLARRQRHLADLARRMNERK